MTEVFCESTQYTDRKRGSNVILEVKNLFSLCSFHISRNYLTLFKNSNSHFLAKHRTQWAFFLYGMPRFSITYTTKLPVCVIYGFMMFICSGNITTTIQGMACQSLHFL